MYLGSWNIDELLTFPANTHVFSTGAATDADSVPTYRVYEDETGTAILTGSMALLDSANTAGFYSEQLTLSAANGFEAGKSYTIYITATVSSVAGSMSHTFQIADFRGTARGVCTTGGSTTSIVTSSLTPAAAVTDQFKGRIVIFDRATTTANLRGQATDITGSSSLGVLTVTALTTAPATGDTFIIV